MSRWSRGLALLWLVSLVAGCASYPVNPPLHTHVPDAGYRFNNLAAPDNSDSLFVILTFSGGGTRAGALSYGVMEKLRATEIVWEGRRRTLLDEVDVISSVSGGSFTAAYYGLFRDGLFEGYEQAFLYRDIEADLKGLLFQPGNWVRLASPTFGRIELATELYNREIFRDSSFADLQQQGRPFILLNATDMSLGAQFTFTQAQFDLMCSDLAAVKVGRAVAASSNFPVAFTPLVLKNYGGSCGFDGPAWVRSALKDRQANPPRFNRARIARSYLDAGRRPFIHLLDGGVSDNIGLRGPLVALRNNDPAWNLPNKISRGGIRKLVVISVDAKTEPALDFDQSDHPPGLVDVLSTIANVPMGNYSQDTVEIMRDTFKDWQKARAIYAGCRDLLQAKCPAQELPTRAPNIPDLYRIYVGFDDIRDVERRRYFQSMATSFSLPDKQVDDLRDIAQSLMDESREFQRLQAGLR